MPVSDHAELKEWLGRKRQEWAPYQAMLAEYDYWLNRGRYGQSRLLATNVIKGEDGGSLAMLRSQYVETWADTVARSEWNQFLLAEPVVRVPLGKNDIDDEAEREKAEDFELATQGLVRLADATVETALEGWNSFDEAAKAWLIRLGKVVTKGQVYRLRPGQDEAGVEVWFCDPKTFLHDFGTAYPRRFFYERSIEKKRLQSVMQGYHIPQTQKIAAAQADDFITYGELWEEVENPETGEIEVYSMWLIDDELAAEGAREPVIRRQLPGAPFTIGTTRFDPTQHTTWDGRRGPAHTVGIEWHAVPSWAGGSLEILNLIEVLEALSMDSTALATLPPIIKRVKEGASQEEVLQTLYPGAQPTVTQQNVVWEVLTGLAQGQFQARETLERLYKRLDGYYNSRLISAEANPGDATSLYDHQIQQWKATLTPVARAIGSFKRRFCMDLWNQFDRAQTLRFSMNVTGKSGAAYGRDISIDFDVSRFPKRRAIEWIEPPNFPLNMNLAMQLATQGVDNALFSPEDAVTQFFKLPNAREQTKRAEAALLERQQPNIDQKLMRLRKGELRAAEDALRRIQASSGKESQEAADQALMVLSIQYEVDDLEARLKQGSSPRPAPAPPRPGPDTLSPEDRGAFAPTAMLAAGQPGLPKPGALPNPAQEV